MTENQGDVLLLKKISEFKRLKSEINDKLPYHLNIIDELHANENANSRILNKLLQYTEKGEYPFLKSFLKSLGNDFANIKIQKPQFHTEKDRIDVSIKETGRYAIIIENKIHGAIDQEGQISRYIKVLEQKGFNRDQIFILYLTREGGSPSEDSFLKKDKEEFKNRYLEISFKNEITPWLEDNILPLCRYKDTMLISGIQQYIDYLKGLFHQRENEKIMDNEMKKLLENDLTDGNINFREIGMDIAFKMIKEKKEDLSYISNLYTQIQKEILRGDYDNRSAKVESVFPRCVIRHNIDTDSSYFFWGIEMSYKNEHFLCAIGLDGIDDNTPYYGITARVDKESVKIKTIEDLVEDNKNIFLDSAKSPRWYCYIRTSRDSMIDNLIDLVERMRKIDGVSVVTK